MNIATLTSVDRYFKRDMSDVIHALNLLEDNPDLREEIRLTFAGA